MDFSCGDDFDKTESLILMKDESRESRNRGGGGVMDLSCQNGVETECNIEFWPIEHPTEPLDEDHPVKCPMPDSSLINNEGFSDSLRKRTELSAAMNKEGIVVVAAEPPARAVRKRHHTSTHGDHTLTPLWSMPPLYPHPTHNITVFQMLQQFDKFES